MHDFPIGVYVLWDFLLKKSGNSKLIEAHRQSYRAGNLYRQVPGSIFMHTGTQRKYVSKSRRVPGAREVKMALPYSIAHGHPEEICQQKQKGARRTRSEDGSSLLDCTQEPRGRMSAKAEGCLACE